MKIHENVTNGITVLRLEGDMDIYNCQTLRDHIKGLTDNANCKVVANMDMVSYIDSSGIGALISAVATLKKSGGGLKLCHLSDAVEKVVDLTRLTGFFEIYKTEPEAVSSFEV